MKKLYVITFIFVVCITSLGVINDRLEQRFLPRSTGVVLQGLPDGFSRPVSMDSYQGAHPIEITRPEESFQFPISLGQVGPIDPLFSGANDYPFLCATEHSGLGQPLVDNQKGIGIEIFQLNEAGRKTKNIIGYSQDCSLATDIEYYIKDKKLNGFIKVDGIAQYKNIDDQYIRVETGTINRFIYMLAIPVSSSDLPERFNQDKWNNRLIYRFKGGVGVGRQQGSLNVAKLLYEHEPQLMQGYALAFSTGTQTSNHYDIWLSEDTALRVKKQFETQYGKPLYTVGIGASGGAIQQYLLAQNRPGIIDAAIPLYSYPDMVTQVNYALDCELMEYYFDVTDSGKKWDRWSNRRLIEGSNALDGVDNRYGSLQGGSALLRGQFNLFPSGASECTNGWRGPSQHINNPKFYDKYHGISAASFNKVDWSHWGNLKHIYGTDGDGFGKRFWGNDGVQYGLRSLLDGSISIKEFISINKFIGGWKPLKQMKNERFWHISGDDSLRDLSVWSHHNMTHKGDKRLAARTKSDASAAAAAYQSGLVFLGLANLPIIDIRHYLDHKLDMHHSVASFTSRQRIKTAMGDAQHHLIWMAEKNDDLSRQDTLQSLPINDALIVLDQWLINLKENPKKSLAENKPEYASDRCYDKNRNIIDNKQGTWDGPWNEKKLGVCQAVFPHFSHSRMVSGGGIHDDVIGCERVSVDVAIKEKLYGDIDIQAHISELNAIFPNGVCRYPMGADQRVLSLLDKLKHLRL